LLGLLVQGEKSMSTSAVPPFGYGTSSSETSSPEEAIASVHVAQSVAGRRSVAVMVTATCEPLSVNPMFGLHAPREGDFTVDDFAFGTFGSSDGFEGENVGGPPREIAEMILVLSELMMCVAFTLPTFAAIFRLVGFDVPPELDVDPPELDVDPPEELPPDELLDVPPQSSSKDFVEKRSSHDESSRQVTSFAVGEL
jgi:hypothetical protein